MVEHTLTSYYYFVNMLNYLGRQFRESLVKSLSIMNGSDTVGCNSNVSMGATQRSLNLAFR